MELYRIPCMIGYFQKDCYSKGRADETEYLMLHGFPMDIGWEKVSVNKKSMVLDEELERIIKRFFGV